MKSFKQWLFEDADDITGIYPPGYEGIGNYPPSYFGGSNPYIKDSLDNDKKDHKKKKKKHKKKDD
jgi:hypothetical protein